MLESTERHFHYVNDHQIVLVQRSRPTAFCYRCGQVQCLWQIHYKCFHIN